MGFLNQYENEIVLILKFRFLLLSIKISGGWYEMVIIG